MAPKRVTSATKTVDKKGCIPRFPGFLFINSVVRWKTLSVYTVGKKSEDLVCFVEANAGLITWSMLDSIALFPTPWRQIGAQFCDIFKKIGPF
jgi:hypothetical protein